MTRDFKLHKGTYIKIKSEDEAITDNLIEEMYEDPRNIVDFIKEYDFERVDLLYLPSQSNQNKGYLVENVMENEEMLERLEANVNMYGKSIKGICRVISSLYGDVLTLYTPFNLTQGMKSVEVKLEKNIYVPKEVELQSSEDLLKMFDRYTPLVKDDGNKFYVPLIENVYKERYSPPTYGENFAEIPDTTLIVVDREVGVVKVKKRLVDRTLQLLKIFFK